MSPSKMASIAAIIIFLISFFVYIAVQMSGSDYDVLYSDLELEDAKQIKKSYKVGDEVAEEVSTKDFGRSSQGTT